MKLDIIHMHNCLLTTKTDPIPLSEITSEEVQNNIQQMLDMYPSMPAVGLAAPQVGWNARVFLIGIDEEHSRGDNAGHSLTTYINPQYEIIDDKRLTDWEACFSVFNEPHQQLMGHVSRYKTIKIKAYDSEGNIFEEQYDNFRARVFQHEYDHLDGIRYVNRLKNNSAIFFRQDDRDYQIYMHQLPKALRSGKYPELNKIIPMLDGAPHNGISKKLLKEITTIYDSINK